MKFQVIAQLEADSIQEAWSNLQHLPLVLTPQEIENAEENGITDLAIFETGGRGRVEWKAS